MIERLRNVAVCLLAVVVVVAGAAFAHSGVVDEYYYATGCPEAEQEYFTTITTYFDHTHFVCTAGWGLLCIPICATASYFSAGTATYPCALTCSVIVELICVETLVTHKVYYACPGDDLEIATEPVKMKPEKDKDTAE